MGKIVAVCIKIQKICNTKTEKGEMPWRFEEVFVNGKKIETFGRKEHNKKEYSASEQNESKRKLIPLFDYESSNNEEIVISKKMVKLGELIITE
jgi:hypothetical protein